MSTSRNSRPSQPSSLGAFLATVRKSKQLTLRAVEEATERTVSNAYLSQLENDKISKPSPNILYKLAAVYGISYEALMEKAGYFTRAEERSPTGKHGRAATFAIADLTPEEEQELLEYLAFLRSRPGRK
jgi:HTH-type transcriptional regulator, competence development regulator